MKIVSICKDQSCLAFGDNSLLTGIGLKVRFENAKEGKEPALKPITTLDEFDKLNGKGINSYLSSGDYAENQVFIMPEGWEEGSVDKGYEMAVALLDSVGQSKTFNLRFVSMYRQDQLLRLVKNEYRVLVKSFPHLWLFDKEVVINPRAYSSIHFKLIRDIAVSDSGRLAAIRHDVKNIVMKRYVGGDLTEAIQKFQAHALGLLDDLDSSSFIKSFPDCPKRLAAMRILVKEVADETNGNEFQQATRRIQNGLYRLIDEIDAGMVRSSVKTKAKQAYRVLIIDDELEQRKELYNFFSNHYTLVACNDLQDTLSQEEMEQWEKQLELTFPGKKNTKTKTAFVDVVERITLKNQHDTTLWSTLPAQLDCFDLIVLDLLYKDQTSGSWLPFDGLDLYLGIREQSPFSTVRIITSLPRNEISAILGEEGVKLLINHLFTKGNGWEQLEGCLLDRMDGINKECEYNTHLCEVSKGIRGPKKGFFKSPAVSRMIAELYNDKEFTACFKAAEGMVDPQSIEGITRDRIELLKHRTSIIKYDKDLLTRFLAHRIAFIRWAASNHPHCMTGIDVRNYHLELKDLKVKAPDKDGKVSANENYYRTIGFTCKNPDDKERNRQTVNDDKEEMLKVDLNPLEMFEEEVLLYRDVSRTNSTMVEEDSLNYWIYYILKYYYQQNNSMASVVPDIGRLLDQEVVGYDDLENIFNRCDDIVKGRIPKTEKDVKVVAKWVETVLSRDAFESMMLGVYYDSVIEILKQNNII